MESFPIKIEMGNLVARIPSTKFGGGPYDPVYLMHSHSYFEFHVISQGQATIETEKGEYTLGVNDFVILFPHTMHRVIKVDDDTRATVFSASVEKNTKSDKEDYYTPLMEYIKSHEVLFQHNPLIGEYIKILNSHIESDRFFREDTAKARVVLLFAEILTPIFDLPRTLKVRNVGDFEDLNRVSVIEEYFNTHYMENITLAELSKNLNLSEKQTNRNIIKLFGESFSDHLHTVRMRTAKKLLSETHDEIKDIAESVGYGTYNGFYLAFKRRFGISPLYYRMQNISKDR